MTSIKRSLDDCSNVVFNRVFYGALFGYVAFIQTNIPT